MNNMPSRRRPFIRWSLVGIALCAIVLVSWIRHLQDNSYNDVCHGHLIYIASAMREYEYQKRALPPVEVDIGLHRSRHSWRLSLFENYTLGPKYNWQLPWDSAVNKSAAQQILSSFDCPRRPGNVAYHAIVGPETAFYGTSGIKFSEIRDGRSNSLLLIEVPHKTVDLSEPTEIMYADLSSLCNSEGFLESPSSRHNLHFLFADWTVCRLMKPMDLRTLQAIATISGKEEVSRDTLVSMGVLHVCGALSH